MKNISFGDFVTFLGKLIASIWLIIAAVVSALVLTGAVGYGIQIFRTAFMR